MTAALPPPISLHPLTLDDAREIAALLADDEAAVLMTATFPWPMTEPAMRDWIAARLDISPLFAIRLAADGRLVGTFSWRGDPPAATIGYWIGRDFRGRGLAQATVRAGEALLRARGYTELLAETFAENAISRHVLERTGFALVEEYLAHVRDRGGYRLSARYRRALDGV